MKLTKFSIPRRLRVPLVVSTMLGVALSVWPRTGAIGVESAVLAGLVLPPFAGAVGARLSHDAPAGQATERALLRALAASLALVLPVLGVLALNALRVKNCKPLEGLAYFALGPAAGCALAGCCGAALGALAVRRRAALWLAALLPCAPVVLSLVRMVSTPGIFAYGHFFGYFPGALYDEVPKIPEQLLSLRRYSLCWAAFVVLVLLSFRDPHSGRLRRALQPGRRAQALLAAAFLAIALYGEYRGAELGHNASTSYIGETLGGFHRSRRCAIHYPHELRRDDLLRFAADCDVRVVQLERWFGVTHKDPIGVYLFRGAGEKRRLMGAGGTNIAKPWRHEVYVQEASWPHRVLPHELAHAIAANFARGPFRISGSFHGLLPDFALIEGTAVAAVWAQSSTSGMTPHQWTRAMLELHMVAPLRQLLGAGFAKQQKRMAYTLSGSLLRYVKDTYGAAKLRAIYRTGDVARPLGMPLEELERRWHAFVRSVPLPGSARALARQRFSGRGVLSVVCPHEKAELKAELRGLLATGDDARARQVCGRIIDIDPAEMRARVALVGILARQGNTAAAAEELAALRVAGASASVVSAAEEQIADEAWRRGRLGEARQAYERLLRLPRDRDDVRQLQVKALALRGSERQARLIFELLVGQPGRSPDGFVILHLVRDLRAERSDGLAHYLEARQLYFRERYRDAAELFEEAQKLGLPTRELDIEARRVLGVCWAALSVIGGEGAAGVEAARARTVWSDLAADEDVDEAVRAEATDWVRWLELRRELEGA